MSELKLKVRGRQKGWTRTGSVLAGKKLTEWEAIKVQSQYKADKERWAHLFSLNAWRPRV
jgi:hypothetical protein